MSELDLNKKVGHKGVFTSSMPTIGDLLQMSKEERAEAMRRIRGGAYKEQPEPFVEEVDKKKKKKKTIDFRKYLLTGGRANLSNTLLTDEEDLGKGKTLLGA